LATRVIHRRGIAVSVVLIVPVAYSDDATSTPNRTAAT
jgi:hypothetical protein